MSNQTPRFTSSVLVLMLLAPMIGALVPVAAAEDEDIRVLAVYASFGEVPSDDAFLTSGLTPGYRFAAIPAIILAGPASAVQDITPGASQIVYDEPIQFHLETATISSKARDVWGNLWHAGADAPMTKDGVPLDGRGVTVGVVDTGANAAHPDLWYAPLAVAPGVTPQPKIKACVHTTGIAGPAITVPVVNCDEQGGHGTHVAGIVAGTGMMADMGFTIDGAGEYNGAAPGASLVVSGIGIETIAQGGFIIDGLAGLDYMYATADEFGTRVVTNSWSSGLGCTGSWNNAGDAYHAISNKLVQDKGITVLWAANNDGATRPIGTSAQGRNPMPGVIMVANYDDKETGTRDGDVNPSSGDGCVTTGGSATNMIWTWPDVAAPGTNIVSTAGGTLGAVGGALSLDGPMYASLTGTSMSTPLVAGVAALLYQAYPEITPAEVEEILIQTAMPWTDGVTVRGVAGSAPYWGPSSVNNANAGFTDKTLCRISPEIAARAEANDPTLDATYPGFRAMVQPRLVNGLPVDADANDYVCRDFKRGHGLVDAKAAVLAALALAGDDETEGLPEISITAPSAGEVVTQAQATIEGLVDLTGQGPNVAPTVTLAASATSGPAPLTVDFSPAASDSDGTIVAGTLDFGDGEVLVFDGAVGGLASHTYANEGAFTAVLSATDNDGAAAMASVTINVGGLPSADPDITGSAFAYNFIADWPVPPPSGVPGIPCPGASNIVALGTTAADDAVPKYPPASAVCLQARSVASAHPTVPLNAGSSTSLRIFDADGDVVHGPEATSVRAEVDTVTGEPTGAYSISAQDFTIPATWSGRYYLGFAIETTSGPVYMFDPAYGGIKPIDVIGPEMIGVPGLPESEPGSDEGHSIGDADDDGTTPMSEIQWADVATDSDSLNVVFKVGMVPPEPEGAAPTIYAIFANGIEFESYLYGVGFGGARVYDATNGVQVVEALTEWDTSENVVTVEIPRSYIMTVTDDCPCIGHLEAQAGPPFLGDPGQPALDRAPNTGERSLQASWQLLPITQTSASSQSDPENTDPEGDAFIASPNPNVPSVPNPPHSDVTKVWVSRETETEVDITLEVADLASAPPGADAGNPARASWNYGVDFCSDNAAATYTAASGNFAGVSGVVCYRLSAATSALGVKHSGGGIQQDGSGSCGVTGLTKNAVFNNAASTVTWTVDLTLLTVRTISAGVGDCTTTPQVRDAPAPTDGNLFSRFSGRTGFSGPVVTLIIDDSDASASRSYELGDDGVETLVANAGGDLAGAVDDDIAIAGSATGGTPPYACMWSGSDGVFADPSACATSVSFASAGVKSLTLTVTDAASASAVDTVSVDVVGTLVEHVEVVVGGVVTASAPVDTSGSDTDTWSVLVDLSGLPNGETDVVATWFDAEGDEVATTTSTIDLQLDASQAIVEILSPDADATVNGESVVSGTAGHTSAPSGSGGDAPAANHYGFPVWSGLNGGRAATTIHDTIDVPCAACEPDMPGVGGSLSTSLAWQIGPGGDTDGLDGRWLNIAGHGGDAFELTDATDVEIDILFYTNWDDADTVGQETGAFMPKTGTVPPTANWAFLYIRHGLEGSAPNQWGASFDLALTPTIVQPGAVQGLAAASGPGTVALSWSAPVNDGGELLGYKVMRDGADLATVTVPGYVDTPGNTATHVYAVFAYNSAGDGAPTAVSAAAGQTTTGLAITNPLDGALAVPATTTIDGTYTPEGEDDGPDTAFANTHYVALLNLNSPCGNNLGYGDHLIFQKLSDHAVDVLGVPAENIHVYNEAGVALQSSVDAANYNRLTSPWKTGAVFDGPARWSVFQPALRAIAEDAAAGEAAGGAPARIFFLQSSHGLQASLLLGDGATDSMFCLMDVDVSSTMLGDLLNDIDADVAAAHKNVEIEWSINIDCSFCGGFVDSPLPAPGLTPAHTAGVVGDNRVVEVGCTWVTECFGNPAVTYDHMFNECVFTGEADGYGPLGAPAGEPGDEILVGDPAYSAPDGVITLEESYWCAIESSHELLGDPIALQQMFQISDKLSNDMFGLNGFPLWEADSSLDLGEQDPDMPLSLAELPLADTRATDPTGDGLTPFSDLTSLEASATTDEIFVDLGVADLTLSSLELEDEIQYDFFINGNRYSACYLAGEPTLWGWNIPSEDPVTGEPTEGASSSGSVVYDTANGVIHLRVPTFELNDQTLPAAVYATSVYGDCGFSGVHTDDRAPDGSDVVKTSEDDDEEVTPSADKVTVALTGPASLGGDATLNATTSSWRYDPAGDLADGHWTATATYFLDDGAGFVQVGTPVSIQFTVGVSGDIEAPTAPVLSIAGTTVDTVDLAWTASTDNVGVDHYEVFRDGASLTTTTDTSYSDSGLAADTTYSYVVKAFDAAGNSAASAPASATTDEIGTPTGTVTLRAGAIFLGTTGVDTSTNDPAAWDILVDWTILPEGTTEITADYDDGEGLTASDSIQVVVTRGLGLEITSPLDNEDVFSTFTTSGTVEGAGGPDGVAASGYMFSDGTIDPAHPGFQLAGTDALAPLEAALASAPGFLGMAPSLSGERIIDAWFKGDAPATPTVEIPAGWTLVLHGDVELERAIERYPDNHRVREGPPAPAQAVGIGPGSHFIQTRPDGTFGCTANFVWKDTNGKYYLGAAGHCFLPADKTTTHGPGADYNPALTTVRVCVSGCQFGGQAGFLVTGSMVTLGPVAYARQTVNGDDLGNDFGIVEIPTSLYGFVHPEMHVWNGPTSVGTMQPGEPVLLYGNAAAFGETWPTMARAGLGSAGQGEDLWSAVVPSAPGDSGGAIVSARATAPATTVVEGGEALGILTHIVLAGVIEAPHPWPIAGTTMSRAAEMAAEAGLTITPLMQGDVVAEPDPTVPDAPTLNTLTPGSTSMGLSWSAPANDGDRPITGYTIRYGTLPGSYTETQTVGAVTSATVTGLAPATTYYFVVAATNVVGTSIDSNELDAATQPLQTVPEAPRDLVAFPDNGEVLLTWDAPESDGGSPVTSYTVDYVGGPSGSLTTANVNTATITGLTNGVEYTFTVSATNGVGTGPASNEATATPNGPPPPDFKVEVRADAAGVEVLGWTEADSFDGSSFSHEILDAPSGALTVTARLLQDGVVVRSDSVDVHVLAPPVLTVPATADGNELELVSFTASATDADGDAGLTFSLVDAPGSASIGAVSGDFSWTPQYGDAGVHLITVRVTDPEGLTDEEQVTVTIGAVNRPPILDAIGNQVVGESQTLTFTVTASDHEADALTFSASGLPAGATFDTGTQVFTWTPAFGAEGNYPATFSVSDGLASDSETITISVGNVNRPPVLDAIGPQTITENALLLFTASGTDPDEGSFLSTSATGLPAGATFAGGLFVWTPTFAQDGTYTVTIHLSDGELEDTEDVVITVANVDRAPTLNPIATGSAVQTTELSIPLKATDPDNDAITWAINGPDGAEVVDLGNGNAKIVWTPTLDQLGAFTVTVAATAGEHVVTGTTVVTAIFKAGVAASPTSSTNVHASPGDVLSFTTTVTNTGPHADTFAISASNNGGLPVTNVPAPIALAPGESADVTVTVVATAARPLTWTSVTATSMGDGTTSKTARFRYDIPVVVSVAVDSIAAENTTVTDLPSGVVHVTFLDGEVAEGAVVSVTQQATDFVMPMQSTVSGETDGEGDYSFDFTSSWGGLAPGRHALIVAARLPGGFDTMAESEYVLGPAV